MEHEGDSHPESDDGESISRLVACVCRRCCAWQLVFSVFVLIVVLCDVVGGVLLAG